MTTFRNELGMTIPNQVGEQVINGTLNIGYIGFDEHEKTRIQCLRDLLLEDPQNIKDELKKRKGSHAPGTCEWFLNSNEITAWRDAASADFNIFWLSGNPGTGKSTLAIYLVDTLEASFSAQPNSCIIYFFCDTSAHHQNTALAILRGLVYQLCRWSKYLLDQYLLLEYSMQGQKLFESFPALWRIFRKMSIDRSCGQVYIVVDALDECDDESQRQFLHYFEQSYGQANQATELPGFRFLITSRPELMIKTTLSGFPHKDLASYSEVEQDIDRFIGGTVAKLARIGYTPKLQHEATEIFKTKAEGTFLWIGLAYAEIKDLPVMYGLAQLRGLPVGLNRMYQKLLRRALDMSERMTGHQEAIMKLLTTVAVALEPLTPADLAVACSLFEEQEFDERMLFVMETIAMCGFMVIIVDDHVRMLHKTVKDFIFNQAGNMFPCMPKAHAQLASTCVDRLLDDFHTQQAAHASQTDDSFVEYSVKHWASHAQLAQDHYAINLPSQAEFFSHRSESRDAWLTYALALGEDISLYFSIFHVAARWNIMPLLNHTESETFLNPHQSSAQWSLEDFMSGFQTFRGNPLETAASSATSDVFERLLRLRITQSNESVFLSYVPDQRSDETSTDGSSGCYRFQVTPQVMKMVVRNKKIAPELLNILWKQRQEELKSDRDVVIEMIRHQIADGSIAESTFRKLISDIKVDRAILQVAATNERSARGLLGILLDLRGEQSQISQEMVLTAALQFDRSIFQKIQQYHEGELLLTADLVTAVAMNTAHGHDIMTFLLQNASSRHIQHSQQLTECVFEHFDLDTIDQLFDWKSIDFDERLMCVSAKNIHSGYDVFKRFTESSINEHVSERVLAAAAANQGSGQRLFELILNSTKAKSMVTSMVMEIFMNYHPDALDLILRLIDNLVLHDTISHGVIALLQLQLTRYKRVDMFERIMAKLLIEHGPNMSNSMHLMIGAICECSIPLKYINNMLLDGRLLKKSEWGTMSAKLCLADIQKLINRVDVDDDTWSYLVHRVVANDRSDVLENLVFECEDPARRVLGLTVTASAAAQYGKLEILKSALEQGIDVNASYDTPGSEFDFWRPQTTAPSLLEKAILNYELGAFNLLLDRGASIEAGGGCKHLSSLAEPPYLFYDKPCSCAKDVEAFICRVKDVDTEEHLRRSVLHRAIKKADIKVVHLLAKSGLDRRSSSRFKSALELLLDEMQIRNTRRIDNPVGKKTKEDDSVDSSFRIRDNVLQAAHILIREGARLPQIHLSSRLNRFDVTYLLRIDAEEQRRESRNGKSRSVSAPILLPENMETCRILFDAGFNLASLGKDDRAGLIEAVRQDRPDCVKWLLSIGADVNVADEAGYTALHYSVQRSLSITELLYDAGADITAMSKSHETLLHCISAAGKIDVLRWMTRLTHQRSGSSASKSKILTQKMLSNLLDETDDLQRTALHLALYNGHTDVAGLLMSEGSRTDISDSNGLTAQAWRMASLRQRRPSFRIRQSGPYSVSTITIDEALRNPINKLDKFSRNYAFAKLAEQLIKHQLLEEARTACERTLQKISWFSGDHDCSWLPATLECYPIPCKTCQSKPGGYQHRMRGTKFFKCKICWDCWLCERCWYRRWSLSPDLCCFDHVSDFMQIPGPNWQGLESEFVNERQETEREWIQRLCEAFDVR